MHFGQVTIAALVRTDGKKVRAAWLTSDRILIPRRAPDHTAGDLGARDPKRRGPVVSTVADPAKHNAIETGSELAEAAIAAPNFGFVARLSLRIIVG
jgi:hypothetical protein